jgi:hypothetical protein
MTDDDGSPPAPKKRASGITKVAANRYSIRAQARDPRTGRKVERSEMFSGTLREAKVRQAELRVELRESGPRRRRVQMRTYCSTWLASRLPQLKASVVHKYTNNLAAAHHPRARRPVRRRDPAE